MSKITTVFLMFNTGEVLPGDKECFPFNHILFLIFEIPTQDELENNIQIIHILRVSE
jgi:hypothetical protein